MDCILLLVEGGGCDYTIDCGKTWVWLKADSQEELEKKVKYEIDYRGRERISEAILLAYHTKRKFDIDDLFLEDDNEKADKQFEEDKKEAQKEIERLKRKFQL